MSELSTLKAKCPVLFSYYFCFHIWSFHLRNRKMIFLCFRKKWVLSFLWWMMRNFNFYWKEMWNFSFCSCNLIVFSDSVLMNVFFDCFWWVWSCLKEFFWVLYFKFPCFVFFVWWNFCGVWFCWVFECEFSRWFLCILKIGNSNDCRRIKMWDFVDFLLFGWEKSWWVKREFGTHWVVHWVIRW